MTAYWIDGYRHRCPLSPLTSADWAEPALLTAAMFGLGTGVRVSKAG